MGGAAQIVEDSGQDVTAHYQLAAWLALKTAQSEGCCAALLTDGSPTCGSQQIYDGTFSGVQRPGMVSLPLLEANGIRVFSHQQIAELVAFIEEREQTDDSM
jgi:uncharacterized protein YbbK (DUF523 family)